jgi:hypothetical protein
MNRYEKWLRDNEKVVDVRVIAPELLPIGARVRMSVVGITHWGDQSGGGFGTIVGNTRPNEWLLPYEVLWDYAEPNTYRQEDIELVG